MQVRGQLTMTHHLWDTMTTYGLLGITRELALKAQSASRTPVHGV